MSGRNWEACKFYLCFFNANVCTMLSGSSDYEGSFGGMEVLCAFLVSKICAFLICKMYVQRFALLAGECIFIPSFHS